LGGLEAAGIVSFQCQRLIKRAHLALLAVSARAEGAARRKVDLCHLLLGVCTLAVTPREG
jgi:hypothetical protein